MEIGIKSIMGVDVKGKTILFRPDINSPIDSNGKIKNENRLTKTIPVLNYLLDGGAKVAIIAHQGDTLDYQNLIPLEEHAEILAKKSQKKISYIDDVCGDAAIQKVKELKCGEAIILGNLRYLTEEVSTFEKDVKLSFDEMEKTYLIRRLKGLFDIYVNDAFSAAHRSAPSMVGFQRILPSYAGPLFFEEYSALHSVMVSEQREKVFVLGGAKISDAFGMMETVLSNGSADKILTGGVTGVIMLMADGIDVGSKYTKWLAERDLLSFTSKAKVLLEKFRAKIIMPVDLAFEKDGKRDECDITALPLNESMFLDIGKKTSEIFSEHILSAGVVFVNGPAGVYENSLFEEGTRAVWTAVANSKGYTVIGGGDTVTAAAKYIDLKNISYVCTAGGAMVRFLSGKELPLITAMKMAK